MAPLDTTKDLVALFRQQVKITPNTAALEDENSHWTYDQLGCITDNLARRLQTYGVARDKLVGILLNRSANYVVGCLAALRAGGAFLVLELAYPRDLLNDVIDDAKPTVILTEKAYAGRIMCGTPVIILDNPGSTPDDQSSGNELPSHPDEADPERLAFVSYSSGTTGRPKGIANPHRAAVRSYELRFQLSDVGLGDRVACNVFFVWEMLRPLLKGATVVAVPDEASYDPIALVDFLAKHHITETLMTPTLLATVLARHDHLGERLPELRTLWLNGEVVTADLARRAFEALPNTRLLNCYSASETHEIACCDIRETLDENSSICPVGPPMDPEHTYILDEAGQKVQPGTSGELFVGGALLARGYLNLPDTTARSFLSDQFDASPGARMYRTGDVAKMLPSGCLEITGRVGAMIKVRGYSVQPSAVENAIVKHLAIRHVAVVGHGDGLERQLVAYFVSEKGDSDSRASVAVDESGYSPATRRILSAHLAHYMIPTKWVEMDELPTHEVSGKADLKRLPPPPAAPSHRSQPVRAGPQDARADEATMNIEAIRELWAECLNIPLSSVTIEHDFFDLGGHSLALADLARRMSKSFGLSVPIVRLVESPTLQGHLDAVIALRDGYTAAVQADLKAVLQADSVLPSDIYPTTSVQAQSMSDASTVLLTGATGFLGAFILADILEKTPATVICLVRFPNPTDEERPRGMARLRKNLVDLSLWNDSILDRIEILPANLARDQLGLSTEKFQQLAQRIQVIIHAGASVNLVYPYAALRDANVGGTREVLRLACQAGATVHHISTNGVLPPSTTGWPEDAVIPLENVPEKLADGYCQTKWVAEQLVLEAQRRGLPVRVYRPGTISGHSSSGAVNAWDLLTAIIVESLHLGCVPEVDGWLAEMTPVDYVSTAIVTLACHTSTDVEQVVFHLGDPKPILAKDVFRTLVELGYPTQSLGWEDWSVLWTEKRGSVKRGSDLFTVDILQGGMPTAESLKAVTVLNDKFTKPHLERYGLQRPTIDEKLVGTYARHFYSRGWLPTPPKQTGNFRSGKTEANSPLRGRVAVITGASSGIGAAVAAALAREGVHVALSARRVAALEALGHQIRRHGSKVLIQPTDVTDKSQVEALMQATEAALGPIDILVACAGVMYYTLLTAPHIDDWERTVDVNCKGLMYSLASTVPGMISRGAGHVVAISSDAGRKVFPGLGIYSGSKFFIEAVLQSLRLETVGNGLRVTSVQPGNTETELFGLSTDQEAVKKYGTPSGAKVLDPDDVARAVVFTLKQPEHVAVNEVLIEPRDEPI